MYKLYVIFKPNVFNPEKDEPVIFTEDYERVMDLYNSYNNESLLYDIIFEVWENGQLISRKYNEIIEG